MRLYEWLKEVFPKYFVLQKHSRRTMKRLVDKKGKFFIALKVSMKTQGDISLRPSPETLT